MRIQLSRQAVLSAAILALCLSGCATTKIPKDALQLHPDSLKLRQLQTRSFETNDEAKLIAAASGVIQDLGFSLDESEVGLGVLVASKERDATEAGQVVGSIAMAILFGARTPVDKVQKIRISVVTAPLDENRTRLRATFQRIVWNDQGQVSKTESLEDEALYAEFFEKLSKSVFLEANEI